MGPEEVWPLCNRARIWMVRIEGMSSPGRSWIWKVTFHYEGWEESGADRKDRVGEISLESHSVTEVGYHRAEENTFTMCKDVAQEFICYYYQWFCQFLSLKKIMEMAYTKFKKFFWALCSNFWISCLEVHVFLGSFILEHNMSIPEVTP